MKWILVTGGVYSGIGKGCLSAILARILQKNTNYKVLYRKLEPCLQGDIADFPNTIFGEIITDVNGCTFDGDVARAAFYIPNFSVDNFTHYSLGQCLHKTVAFSLEEKNEAPRFYNIDKTYNLLFNNSESHTSLFVVEVGGTAGELENAIVCQSLLRTLGKPQLHIHLTAIVETLDKRLTTKPAQISIESLKLPPDIVLVRTKFSDSIDLEPIKKVVGRCSIVQAVNEDFWAERAYYHALTNNLVGVKILNDFEIKKFNIDPVFTAYDVKKTLLAIITDDAGIEGYQSLKNRIWAWGKGQFQIYELKSNVLMENTKGLIRIGEQSPQFKMETSHSKTLEIVPIENHLHKRNYFARPDWHGTADYPAGELWLFLNSL